MDLLSDSALKEARKTGELASLMHSILFCFSDCQLHVKSGNIFDALQIWLEKNAVYILYLDFSDKVDYSLLLGKMGQCGID